MCSCCGQSLDVDFETITDRISADIMEHPTDSVINQILEEMTAEGK